MGPRQRLKTPLHGSAKLFDIFSPRQGNDGVNDSKHIFSTVIDFTGEQRLPVFGLLALGDIHRNAPDARYTAAGVLHGDGPAEAPSHAAIGTANAEFNLTGLPILPSPFEQPAKHFPIAAIDQLANVGEHDVEGCVIDSKYLLLPLVPKATIPDEVPIPRSHLSGCEGEVQPILAVLEALEQTLGPHRRLDAVEHNADARRELLQECRLKLGEGGNRREFDDGLDLVLEQDRKDDDVLRHRLEH